MKNERIHLRVTEELKEEIKKSAACLGMSVSQYFIYLHKINNIEIQKESINLNK